MEEDLKIDMDVQFEQHYAKVLAFVRKMKHASCFEMMKEFHISYAAAAHLMTTMEIRDIVDVPEPGHTGGRPLLTEKGKILKRERQQREREDKKREAEKPKVIEVPKPQINATPVEPVRSVRKRTRLRTRKS